MNNILNENDSGAFINSHNCYEDIPDLELVKREIENTEMCLDNVTSKFNYFQCKTLTLKGLVESYKEDIESYNKKMEKINESIEKIDESISKLIKDKNKLLTDDLNILPIVEETIDTNNTFNLIQEDPEKISQLNTLKEEHIKLHKEIQQNHESICELLIYLDKYPNLL